MLPTINHTQGDDRDYDFTVIDRDGAAENITGWAFWFAVFASEGDDDSAHLILLTSAAGDIVIDIAAQGLGRILVRKAHTKGKAPGRYRFEFQCRKGPSGSHIETLRKGFFILEAEGVHAE
jgi:hypothetical protein